MEVPGIKMSKAVRDAAQAGDTNALEPLLGKEGSERPDAVNESGWTALMLAATRGHAETVAWLLGCGAAVNPQDQYQNTALHWAAIHGHVAVVQELARYGANANLTDQFGKTPGEEAELMLPGTGAAIEAAIEKGRAQGPPTKASKSKAS